MAKAGPARVSPLWIVSSFLCLTEVVAALAVTMTDGWVQGLLASFVVVFGSGVAAAYFYILWQRPDHLQLPADNGPKELVAAIEGGPRETLAAIEAAANDPANQGARYQLLDRTLDQTIKQLLILLDKGAQLPYMTPGRRRYEFGSRQKDWQSGIFDGRQFLKDLDGTGLVELVTTGSPSPTIQITKAGHAFAEWLVHEGRKADYFDCDLGGWGTPFDPFEALERNAPLDMPAATTVKTLA